MQQKIYNITEKDIDEKKKIISKNYASIYYNLLPDEGETASVKQPIDIGNKDVYALSDIEGYNIDFLDFLKKLGLVEYTTKKPNNLDGWKNCKSLKKTDDHHGQESVDVYYKFNEEKCKKFNDVIVLCGDYVRNSREVSEGVVQILKELDDKINNGRNEEHKGLYLLAGNHDVADYSPEIMSGDTQHDLKAEVLKLGLYPQLLLVNGDGKKLLFQHTNFPYREERNYVVNKKIVPEKAIKLLNDTQAHDKPILLDDGFFNLRYMMPEGAQQPKYYDINSQQELKREIYSDHGIGYDAKIIGHDGDFKGMGYRAGQGGNIYNVNMGNENDPPYYVCTCNKKIEIERKKIILFLNIVNKVFDNLIKSKNLKFSEDQIKKIKYQTVLSLYSTLLNKNINH